MAKCILKRWIMTKPTLSVVFMPFKVTGVVLIIAFLSTAFFKFGILIWWFWPFRPPFKSFIYPGLISYTLYSFTFGKLPMYPFNYTCKEGGQSCFHFFGSRWQCTNVTMWWLLSILAAGLSCNSSIGPSPLLLLELFQLQWWENIVSAVSIHLCALGKFCWLLLALPCSEVALDPHLQGN